MKHLPTLLFLSITLYTFPFTLYHNNFHSFTLNNIPFIAFIIYQRSTENHFFKVNIGKIS